MQTMTSHFNQTAKKLLLALLIALAYCNAIYAQCTNCYGGKQPMNHARTARVLALGNGGLRQSCLMQNICGLNYVQATVLTETRTQPNFNTNGYGFPANLSLNGLPALACATIQKAYLYYGCTYTESSPPATTATVTNPALNTTTVSSVMVGSTLDNICWIGNGSATYRADVTSLISGNGTYTINLNGFANPAYEVDGMTLLVIYTDPTASYSGSIALYDGDLSSDAGISINDTLTSFNVCSATSQATAFNLMGDVQADVSGGVNSETFNGSTQTFTNNFWNYCAIPTSLTSGQNTSYFNTYTNNTSDCYFIAMEGLYWQNTNCTTCVPVVTTMTLTPATSPATCGSNGSASVSVAGAAGPLTYSWSPGGQTTDTAYGLSGGTYTVSVSDGHTCASDTVTVINNGMTISASSTPATCSSNGSATITASGGTAPYTYTWSNGATSSSISAISGFYSCTVNDHSGCTLTDSIYIGNSSNITIATHATPTYNCPPTAGTAIVYVYTGTPPFTYAWSNGQTTDSISGLSAGTYSVTVTDSTGCSSTDTVTVINYSGHINIYDSITPYICPAIQGTASVFAFGGNPPYTYLWSPGGQTTSRVTGLSAGTYYVSVTDSTGCSGTDSVVIYADSVSLTAYSFSVIAAGDSAYLFAYSNAPGTYSWSPAATVRNPNSPYTYVYPSVTTTYTVTETTPCGTYSDTVTVVVGGCANNYNEQICIVTVDTALNKNEVIWGRVNSPPYGSYNVYKYDTNTFVFALIDNQSLNVMSDYIDTASNPSAGSSTYELSTVDSCGESVVSAPHTSIYLTVTAGVNVNVLNWSGYVGFTPTEYRIFRGPAINALTQIDSVPYTTLTFTDSLPPAGSVYMIEAVSPNGPCIPTLRVMTGDNNAVSLSNIAKIKPSGINNLAVIATKLTVYPNPGKGDFTLTYNLTQGGTVRLSVINELGQTVYSAQNQSASGANTQHLNLENLGSGIYSLRLETDNGLATARIAVIK